MNPLIELWSQRQSFWLDYIRKSLLTSGELKKYIEQDGLRGMTSNPTIFEKAISSGNEYDADLKKLALQRKSGVEIFEALSIKDIQKAADILRPVFKSSGGTDGFVSLEVSPNLGYDTEGTIQEAKRLWKKTARPNLMIKVPATQAGIPAIEELLAAGLNINITLLFSVDFYKQVLEAYLKALERRVKKGLPIKQIASVASFFVSRVDTIIDKALDQKIALGGAEGALASKLLHKAAIANAKLSYEHYLEVVQSDRFLKLAGKGAQVQRLLWASTGTKDKRLSDTVYIDNLIGPDTVNTMPPATIDAFRDHGKVQVTLTQGFDQARADIAALGSLGIDFEAAMQQLQTEGVKSFNDSFESLLRVVGAKRELLTGRLAKKMNFSLGSYKAAFDAAIQKMGTENWLKRIWEKDPTLWKSDAAHAQIIKNSLGWLAVPGLVQRNIKLLAEVAADVKKGKFTHALLLGMGGSSLCPEVLRLTFGKKAGFPDLAILDSTEPASVMERANRSKPEKTLYIVASKSGSTTEPNAFLAAFYEMVRKKKGAKAGENFIAITDPGTQMERIAKEKKFRRIILNPPDIGGRYSALSFFGMAPAAIMGLPVEELLTSAMEMAAACSPLVPAGKNPGAMLGAALGVLANAGRDKATFFLSKDLASFSTWVEQLIAESTGKEGKGIVPVESEPLQAPAAYGNDRVFVAIGPSSDKAAAAKLQALKKAGHPVIQIALDKKTDIAAEFFLWEFATAVAGALLGIDAFDQPNVQESKDLTKEFLEQYRTTGRLSTDKPAFEEDGLQVFITNGMRGNSLKEVLTSLLAHVTATDYVALLAYLTRNGSHEKILQAIRAKIQAAKKVATTVGFGPRFLHSTGQLHKGGADNGVFLQITADDKKDLPIPGEPYTFGVLKEAQALGDLSALKNKHRRAIRINLKDTEKGLIKLKDVFDKITQN